MIRYIPLFLLAAACGSPFTAHELIVPPHADAGDASDPGSDPTPEAGDAGNSGDARPDHHKNPHDSGGLPEASHDSGPPDHAPPPPKDSGPPVDSGCTTFVSGDPTYCGAESSPGQYCVIDETSGGAYPNSTPAECQCAGTYTCACILAHLSSPCGSHGMTVVSCVGGGLEGNLPTVTCE